MGGLAMKSNRYWGALTRYAQRFQLSLQLISSGIVIQDQSFNLGQIQNWLE